MQCDKFKCDMCECFGECNSCQEQDCDECDGLK